MRARDRMAHALLVAMGLGLGGLAVFAVQYQRPPDPGFADPAFRDARAAGSELSVDDWRLVKEREQRALAALDLGDDAALREWVGARDAEIEPTEAELQAVWDEQRAVFGERTFEASRETLVRIARLRQIRAELETASR